MSVRIHLLFHRLWWLAVAAGFSSLFAQQTVSFTVSTDPVGATFTVDGTSYTTAAQFQWPTGSKHIVSYYQSQIPAGTILAGNPNGTFTGLQLSQNQTELYTFGGWQDNTGLLSPSQNPTQIVTADGTITSLTAKLTLSYRVLLSFQGLGNAVAPACGDAGQKPPSVTLVGYVYINNSCYWDSALLYFPAGSSLTLNAFPMPGFVFLGWNSNLGSNAFLRSYVLTQAIQITPMFGPSKRVRVETKPLGLNVLVDRTKSPTLMFDTSGTQCPAGENLPLAVASNTPPLCFGDFDFVPGSSHLIAAPSPETDINGKLWVFNSWTSASGQGGQAPNTIYSADNLTATQDKIIVSFDPGVQVSFLTSPAGLKLTVDGRDNWPSYNFVWALGSTHTITASAQQADAAGRKYTLIGWSNGGSATQTVTMDQNAVKGLRMVANYNQLSRLVVQTVPAGQTVQVDGTSCMSPCNIDKPNGTQVHITAATSISQGTGARLDFANWSDGGAAEHMYPIQGNLQTVTANYTTLYQLTASGNPGNGVNFTFSPSAPDGYYPANGNVTVMAHARNGFKFLRWGGDLTGTYPSGVVNMSAPHAVVAQLLTVPYIAPAGVENGAGTTPDAVVAAGSIAMVLGESLAAGTVIGPVNPLAQTLGNVTVTMGERLLPLFSVTPEQITLLIPSDLTPGNYTLQVQSPGQPVISSDFTVVRNAPGIFTNPANSKAYMLAFHRDGSLVSAGKPAVQGEQITFFGTGFGPFTSRVVDGFYPPNPPPKTADPVTILAAGQTFQPDWAGAAPGYTGLVEVKFTMTDALPSGKDVDLQVRINGRVSNTVVLPMQ